MDLIQRGHGYDLWTISQYQDWLEFLPELPSVIAGIRNAFYGVQLGNGIGLFEAKGMDDYFDDSALAKLRELDEKSNWENISPDELNECQSSPSFFDAAGFHFHLPAFLIAELKDEHHSEFIGRIIEKRPETGSWIDLLSPCQAEALIAMLTLVKHHPGYIDEKRKIEFAVKRFEFKGANGRFCQIVFSHSA